MYGYVVNAEMIREDQSRIAKAFAVVLMLEKKSCKDYTLAAKTHFYARITSIIWHK